jgi:hypothetical protein
MMGRHLFAPSMKKGKPRRDKRKETDRLHDIPDSIIGHVTKTCRGNRPEMSEQLRPRLCRQ